MVSTHSRGLLAIACFAAAVGCAAYALAQRSTAPVRIAAPAVAVRAEGIALPKGGDADALAWAIADRWESAPLTLVIAGEDRIVRTRREFGGRVDRMRLRRLVQEAIDTTSSMRRVHAMLRPGRALDVPVPFELDATALLDELTSVKDGYDRAPRDARIDRTGAPMAHEHGRLFDVHGTIDALSVAMRVGAPQAIAAATEQPARRTVEELRGASFAHVLGFFETRYNALEEAQDRVFNLRVAASKIDGRVVLPGETFDFNAVVGERSEANGFRPAPVIAGGELVDGVGGGTCQVAGTLHAATFFAGLPILERRPHSRPSSYLFMGLDAVVTYPQLNFRFTNDLPFPIAIGFTVEAGIARAEIRGARTTRMVTFVRRVEEMSPYDEREVGDPSLPLGVRVLKQRGAAGFRIRGWRIVRDVETNQAIRTHFEDAYPPTQQIWSVGSGGAPPADYVAPPGDDHGEYTADGYLSVTQGVGIEGIQIVRRAGVSGTPGWTARLGYPQAEP